MDIHAYQRLNFREESSFTYRRRLQAFAIANRFPRASNYIYVADQIVHLGLISEFKQFNPASEIKQWDE
ncbi:hypothetical protein EXU85_23050 [Spirosoma sp. KCTC 42546]|uniref:hypothetical protein n=1 Tax=Spirosoma sp. KCTC 42546 TaxID=2520506 RepID=UPI0011595A05|nr:hypothetical protein [Spirosoma sp. KCTC 42546]QDK81329.1 hypothetical protein EXU85_23050 [Spirosoma sp. KCTC 42546]